MKFSDFDAEMRVFETSHDYCILPGMYVVARLDGRSFTRLTRETMDFDAPFDPVFRDHMVEAVKHLMECGFPIIFGYTQSDEISLLFRPDFETFSRKLRKLNSVLAGEASAFLSRRLCETAVMDCRISQLPSVEHVQDYFRWRAADALRNALNSHCYWHLRHTGLSARKATSALHEKSVEYKHNLLFRGAAINFDDLPSWQKNGVGVLWEVYVKQGIDPRDGSETNTTRRRRTVLYDLRSVKIDDLVHALIQEAEEEK